MKVYWEHLSLEDVSHGQIIRKAVNVAIPAGKVPDETLLSIAKEAINLVKEPTNAIIVFFWEPGQNVGQEFARAVIEYAPYRDWSLAGTVPAGDTTHHEFKLTRNSTK